MLESSVRLLESQSAMIPTEVVVRDGQPTLSHMHVDLFREPIGLAAFACVQMTIRTIHPFNEGRIDGPGSWRSRQGGCQSLLRAIDTARLDIHDASLPAGLVHDGIDQVGGRHRIWLARSPRSAYSRWETTHTP